MKKLRKGIIKTISILFSLLFVCSFVLVGCTLGTTRTEDESVYNEAGGFYEIEDNEAINIERIHVSNTVDCLLEFNFDKWEGDDIFYVAHSSSNFVTFVNIRIVEQTDELGNVIARNSIGLSSLKPVSDGYIQINKGDYLRFGPFDSYSSHWEDRNVPYYIEIIAKKGNDIIGYGLIGYRLRNYYYNRGLHDDELFYLQEDGTFLSLQEDGTFLPIGELYEIAIIPYTLVKFAWLSEKEIGKVTEEMVNSAIEALK